MTTPRSSTESFRLSSEAIEKIAHGEKTNIRVRRYGGVDVPYAGVAEKR